MHKVRKELFNNSNKNIRPLKKFGQNYLQDRNILLKIVGEINPQPEDNLVEIGPGLGSLTSELYGKTKHYTAVEIDTRVIDELQVKFPDLKLINADFLKYNLSELCKESPKLKIAGNIPYNLTSPIFFKMMEERSYVKEAVLMIQLEVAQRLVAKLGTKEYGILSVLLNAFADVKLCFKVSPNVFYPKPKVYSAVIHLFFRDDVKPYNEALFKKVVKAAFSQRRKTLRNSLSSIFTEISFEDCPVDLSLRAERLTIADFILLTNFIHGQPESTIKVDNK